MALTWATSSLHGDPWNLPYPRLLVPGLQWDPSAAWATSKGVDDSMTRGGGVGGPGQASSLFDLLRNLGVHSDVN